MKKNDRFTPLIQLIPLLLFLFISACRSSKPAYPVINSGTPNSTASKLPEQNNPETGPEKEQKTVAKPEQKVTQGANPIPEKTIKLRDENSQTFSDEEEDAAPAKQSVKNRYPYKFKKGLKDKDHWFSGIFIGTGMVLMLTALVMVIIGSGPAGLLALIGGGLFLIGFVGAMVVLIED